MQKNNEPRFEVLRMHPENTNSVLVSVGGDAVIFDAWGRADEWESVLAERGLKLRAIYATHGHSDHISAAPDLAAKHNVPWYLNDADNDLIMWGNGILEFFQMPTIAPDYTRPETITAGTREILPGIKMNVIETPGHSAGGVCYYFPDFTILLTGDTLFQNGFGRYDLPGGDIDALQKSIVRIYNMNFPDETYVVHGHGADSSIALLKEKNPYFHGGCCGGHCEHDHCCGGGHCGCCHK